MEFEPQDRKVVELLAKLKSVNEGYPSEMLAARRQAFMNNMAGAGLGGVGTGTALKHTLKNGNGAAPSTVSTLLEVALVIAMVAEAGTLAYFNRDKIAKVFRSISTTSKVQEIASPPVITSPFPELEISEVPGSATPTGTASEIATSTQIPGVTDDPTSNNNGNNGNNGAATLTDSTPDPSVNNENNGTNGNNGNHYGQTPKPERTRDNNDNQPPNDNPGGGNNDRPPQGGNDKNH